MDIKRVYRITEVAAFAKHIPCWPELAVKKIWPLAIRLPGFVDYMPDEYEGGRRVDRTFFWGVLGTLNAEFVQHLVAQARTQRNAHRVQNAVPPTLINVAPQWLPELLGGVMPAPGKYLLGLGLTLLSSRRTPTRPSSLPRAEEGPIASADKGHRTQD